MDPDSKALCRDDRVFLQGLIRC